MTFSALDSELVGPLFTTPEMRACFSDTARLRAMLATEAALARAQAALGIVPAGLAEAIEAIAPERLDMAALGQMTMLSAVPSIPFVKAVQALLPPELEGAFHKGATTQDILDTALVLQLREALGLIAGELEAVIAGLSTLAAAHRQTPCIGRTYGQHGAPLTFGYKLAVWLAGIAEVAALLPELRERVLVASLAGPVGTLAGLREQGPAVLEGFAKALGLGTTPIAWHARRGRVAELGCWVAQLLGALGKMAGDIANLASTEVGEVAEPYMPGRGGSSAMPHKRNPVSCTVILAAHAAAPGHAATLLQAMGASHERPAGLWHAEWHALPALFGLASGALREARALAEGLEVDPPRMRANLDLTQGLLFADAVAGRLARPLGRARAHALVEEAAAEVRRGGGTLQAVLERHPEVRRAGQDIAGAFTLTDATAAAAQWVEPVLREAARVGAALRPR
ncbi:class-II fumarase/aspartase family protein [Roseomonas marmotae]|uniref:Adenylosuccinate lyase family protein n=1 Tax=Roseomonas marmotae TaxID=2768161 RepID=A0ABS3KB06_9PROT|nr:adenylosuccinate lyase family protein [Roseomonas marmotae]MBO1074654.1 adenylosuccinate lyase family protein [Roseomonas marmotae]QTI81674.1 adenylosuccinate lyase family protein [Roseomonas marmotae]